MNIRSGLLIAASALTCWSASSHQAKAAEILYDGIGFLRGTQSFSDSFTVSSPGTLTVTLGNVNWPQSLSSLNLLMSTPSGALGPEMGAGTQSFNLLTAGDVEAQWFGTAQGPLNAGVYTLEIQFTPGSTNPVPLPTSIALFLSGLALLIWQRKTRSAAGAPANDSHDLSNSGDAQAA